MNTASTVGRSMRTHEHYWLARVLNIQMDVVSTLCLKATKKVRSIVSTAVKSIRNLGHCSRVLALGIQMEIGTKHLMGTYQVIIHASSAEGLTMTFGH